MRARIGAALRFERLPPRSASGQTPAMLVLADEIIAHLDRTYSEPPDAYLHAETLEQREWPHWLELHGSARA
jgi:hypothetical protein